MNQSKTNEYLFLFRGQTWAEGLSPSELQESMSTFMAWFERLTETGVAKGGQPLHKESRVLTGGHQLTITDGPFAEANEAIGGYFLIVAESLDAAVELAKECPTLRYGQQIEVRPVASECPLNEKIRATEALELAALA